MEGEKIKIELNEECNGGKLEPGCIVMANGKKGKDNMIFCNKIIDQRINIWLKLSDLKNYEEKEENSKIVLDILEKKE